MRASASQRWLNVISAIGEANQRQGLTNTMRSFASR